jgi:hypothetical protein
MLATTFGLVVGGSGLAGSTSALARLADPPTASVDPSSLCAAPGNFIDQAPNGDITGCFRVPNLHSATLVVALQAFVFASTGKSHGPTTTTPAVTPGHVTISLPTASVTPGEKVTVTGHDSNPPTPSNRSFGNLCWDGCQDGLQESIQLQWTSHTTFHAVLEVPDTAWLENNGHSVFVHPLQSGTYSVGIQCLGATSGCALRADDAQTTVHLDAPAPTKCLKGQRCATLHLSSSSAPAGFVVNVRGWAPLQSFIGQAFGFNLSIASAPRDHPEYRNFSFSTFKDGAGFNVVVAPKILHVSPGETWAQLGRVPYRSSTFAGPSAIAAEGDDLIAWCQPSGLVITNGEQIRSIPSASAPAALRGTKLTMFTAPKANPECATVLADPSHRDSVYAGFDTEENGSAPPVYDAALYTVDGGATWRTVPVPPGATLESFGGFVTRGRAVVALFSSPDRYDDTTYPGGTLRGLVPTEVTNNGGATWTASTLGCPSDGPCVALGPFQSGNCAMNGSSQPLLVGPAHAGAGHGVRWTPSSWMLQLNSCFSQQLVATSDRDVMLLDASSQYPLIESTSSGEHWTNIVLPKVPGTNYGEDSIPTSNTLLLAPDGSLFSVVTNASGLRQELFRLYPSATSWCHVTRAFGGSVAAVTVDLVRVNATELLWTQSDTQGTSSSRHVAPLTSLGC